MTARFFFACVAFTLYSSHASAQQTLVGGVVGLNVNQLTQPTDPVGEPTLLFGSAFTGVGISAGGTITRDLAKFGPGFLTARGDLLFGYHRSVGFAEHRVEDFRRELILSTFSVRVPAMVGYAIVDGKSRVYMAAGPELVINFATNSAVAQTNVDVLPGGLPTTGVTHVALSAALGFGYKLGGWQLPVELRFAWDPQVGSSTRARFPDYVDNQNTGPYEVAYNWQVFVTLGAIKIFERSSD